MSGSSAAFGLQMRDGAAAPLVALNASGLLPDTRMMLSVADDPCDPSQAVAVANKLTTERVRLVIGHFCSSSSIPASDIYADAGILQVSPSSANPQLTEPGLQIVFQICGRDDQHGTAAAEYIHRNYPNDKIAVLDDKSTAGEGIADRVEAQLERFGQQVIRESYVAGETDFTALISRMEKDGVRIVYIAGCHTEIACLRASHQKQERSSLSAEGNTLYAYAAVQARTEEMNRAGSLNAARAASALRSPAIEDRDWASPVRYNERQCGSWFSGFPLA
ncbi:branched-chain amino acid ABC transporter substrate-binding protein [Bradyrhizobium sp. CCBAU 65884]|uniref:branched-chain amino acid ABC transporter substrate-binding protein n=1 Tax=Bradyrhizobium sp. CCBAU 65884 TaxID=722477 RepID=UPI0023060A07|nr:branched-chain amino acid ABC transporter substrate-binding protein [Bradyrhizobium sp. CCBAU 65884]